MLQLLSLEHLRSSYTAAPKEHPSDVVHQRCPLNVRLGCKWLRVENRAGLIDKIALALRELMENLSTVWQGFQEDSNVVIGIPPCIAARA